MKTPGPDEHANVRPSLLAWMSRDDWMEALELLGQVQTSETGYGLVLVDTVIALMHEVAAQHYAIERMESELVKPDVDELVEQYIYEPERPAVSRESVTMAVQRALANVAQVPADLPILEFLSLCVDIAGEVIGDD